MLGDFQDMLKRDTLETMRGALLALTVIKKSHLVNTCVVGLNRKKSLYEYYM
jgi:hypothetical protein